MVGSGRSGKQAMKTKIWITRYALTKGVMTASAEINKAMATVYDGHRLKLFLHGNDWHRTQDGAVAHVNKMIEAKRRSIVNQIEKLDRLEESIAFTQTFPEFK